MCFAARVHHLGVAYLVGAVMERVGDVDDGVDGGGGLTWGWTEGL